MANNAYNSLGQTFGISTTGNKKSQGKNSNTYNEQGAVNTFIETSKENPTITPAKNIDYNATGETAVNTETNINLTPSASLTTPQAKRSSQPSSTAPTSTRAPQVNRSQNATPSPTASTQRR